MKKQQVQKNNDSQVVLRLRSCNYSDRQFSVLEKRGSFAVIPNSPIEDINENVESVARQLDVEAAEVVHRKIPGILQRANRTWGISTMKQHYHPGSR